MSIFSSFSFDSARGSALDALYAIPHWYACYTRARHEKTVNTRFTRDGIECFLPLMERESQWKDRKKRVAFALFPGYVFGRFTLGAMMQVLSIPGVSTIVGVRGTPAPIADAEILNVRRFSDALALSGVEVEEAFAFLPGAWVRVTSGPFAGVEGIVTEIRGSRRVRVGLQLVGRYLDVDIGTAVLGAIDAPAWHTLVAIPAVNGFTFS